MDLRMEVYSPDLVMMGILEIVDSVIWEEQAFGPGSFQVKSLLTNATRELLREDNVIWFEGTAAGIIEHVESSDGETGAYITVSGQLLNGILSRRCLWGTYNLSDTPAAIMRYLVSECCVSPTRGSVARRAIPIMTLASLPSGGSTLRKQATGGSLLDVLGDIGKTHSVAFETAFDPFTCKAVFTVRYGVNRSVHQSAAPPVFYSTELDDVLTSEYVYDSADYCNAAYVGGQVDQETDTRTYATVEGSETGLARHELFVDARDLSQDIDGETLTDAEYEAALKTRGGEKLAEHSINQTIEMTVRSRNATYEYKTDFFLGDTITLVDERLQVSVDAVVTAVQKSVSTRGEQVTFTFGYDVPTVYQKMKRK